MKQLFLITLLLPISNFLASGQALKPKKVKTHFYMEEYTVLATDKKIKQGDYKKSKIDGSQVLTGKLDNDNRIGEWKYYENEELEQSYSYDEKKMIFHKKPSTPYPVRVGNQLELLNVETPPTYIGSKLGLASEFNKVFEYPMQAKKMGVEGWVAVEIWINEDNSLGKIQLIRGIMEECDQEVVSALQKIPNNWIAATEAGKQVASSLVLIITYSLDSLSEVSIKGEYNK